MLKRTALYDEHKKLNGRLIDFGGWELPVQYTSVSEEHLACRNAAALFDVSHMGEVIVEGSDAEAFLNYLVTNDVKKISTLQAQYTAMCYETGGIVDDLIIYKRGEGKYFVVVNASNTDKDFEWMKKIHSEKKFTCTLKNESPLWSQIAIQGPKGAEILQKLTKTNLSEIKTYWFKEGTILGSTPALLARTGYTGEDGFEIYVAWNEGPKVWSALLEAGAAFSLKPAGLGARDTLRLEAKYPLYGHELSSETNPLEAGLGWVTKLEKADFVGKTAIEKKKTHGLTRKLVGLEIKSGGIPRQGYRLFSKDGTQEIGVLTSGTQSPLTKRSIGVASIHQDFGTIGTSILVEIRGNKIPAEIVETPFFKKK